MEEQQKRQTAFKISIDQLQKGDYVKNEGWNPSYVVDNMNRKVSRVNCMGTAVTQTEMTGSQFSFLLDDSTNKIMVRSFDRVHGIDGIGIADTLQIIGKVREYNDERYIVLEVVKHIDPKWLLVRKNELSLLKTEGKEEPIATKPKIDNQPSEENVEDNSDAQTIYNLIKEEDKGDGALIDDIIAKSNNPSAENIINNLLKEGEVFQVSPGKIKVLE